MAAVSGLVSLDLCIGDSSSNERRVHFVHAIWFDRLPGLFVLGEGSIGLWVGGANRRLLLVDGRAFYVGLEVFKFWVGRLGSPRMPGRLRSYCAIHSSVILFAACVCVNRRTILGSSASTETSG